ncbi:MAG: hypothetical protein NTY51_06295 [Deltaproteobacteria bacterium]|nr:hypothetical protein [Deltaproteobacteria bacterium]
MRYLLVSLLCVAALFAFTSNSAAVGVYNPALEKSECSTLVQRGVIPDTWNKLSEALLVREISWAIDKLTIEAKAFLNQFGQPPSSGLSEVSAPKEAKEFKDEVLTPVKDKPKTIEKKKRPVNKTAKIDKKKSKKTDTKNAKPKKRIKAPLKAL